MSKRRRASRRVILAAMAALPAPLFGATATVTLSGTQIGVTPRFMGVNMGHYMPGSNTTAWLQYSGVNAFRFWASANDYEPTDDAAPFGDGVTSLSTFDSRKAALRADLRANPSSNTYVNWNYFDPKFDATQSGRNKATLNYALSELQKSGIDVVMQDTRSNASQYEVSDWGGKWEQWQHYYAMAFYAAKNYDVQRYQMYNEPDLSGINTSEWVLRMQLASDAIKSAIEDVNAITGKNLSWSVYAPVAAGATSTIDTLGQAALAANRTDYAGRPITYDNFDTYDVHQYNTEGPTFASDQSILHSKIPAYNASGNDLPITFTEFNRYTSGSYSTRTQDLDQAQTAAEFGDIYSGAMSQDVKGMYAFKFSETIWTSSTTGNQEKQKTGFYYVSNTSPYNIQGATRGAETMRLANKTFQGARPRLNQVVSADSTYSSTFSIDQSAGRYYYYSSNTSSTASRTVTVNLSGLGIPTGSVISYEEVSDASYGAGKPSQYMTVPAPNGSGVQTVTFTQPKASTVLLTIPKLAQTYFELPATADAQVSHDTPSINYGLLPTAKVDRSATTTSDDAAYLKFNMQGVAKAQVGRAFLDVTGVNSTDTAPIHVYGILNNSWTETGIDWTNAPDLANASDAQVANVGTDAFPVGQIEWDSTTQEWGIDITDFVRKHGDSDLSFILVRENRFDPDPNNLRPGDTDISRVVINTRENPTGQPRIGLYLNSHPMSFWNTNFDATTSAATSWDAGSPNGAGAVAVFGDFITSPHTVTMDTTMTLGELDFQNLNSYAIVGSQTLTLNGGVGQTSSIKVYQGTHTISAPISLVTPTDVFADTGAVLQQTAPLVGTAALSKSGAGMLLLSAPSPLFSGTVTINSGTVRLTASDANSVTGLGTGPVMVTNATLQLENTSLGSSGHAGPDLTLNSGAVIKSVGNSMFSKSGSPMIANGTSSSPVNVTFSTTNTTDKLTFASAMRSVSAATSYATVVVDGPGTVQLQSGGLTSTTTYNGAWNILSGALQLGPKLISGEVLNALGFKNGDAKQANSITVGSGGALWGAENTPQTADVSTTPNFYRANVVLAGGTLASTGLDANFGGGLTTIAGTTSRVLVYDPANPTIARNVNLVAGAAGTLNNASMLNWAGTLVVDAGTLVNGGALNIKRTGGTMAVVNSASIQINAGATVNLGGAADALNEGVRNVNIANSGTFHITEGSKNIGMLTGGGETIVDPNTTLTASNATQGARLQINGRMVVRPDGTINGLVVLDALSIAPNAALDLNDNDFALNYSGASPFTTIQNLVFNGFAQSPDPGRTGIVSSTSQADGGNEILALLDNALVHSTDWPPGSGNTVADTSIVGKYTFFGDTNLDGMVTADDYGALDANYGSSVPAGLAWAMGDTNFDGTVTADDYGALDANFGRGVGQALAVQSSQQAVPEPGTIGIVAVGATAFFARRRRK